MHKPWESEIKLEEEEAFALIKDQFPELQPKKITLLGSGWDNTAYLLDDRIVFRFPRRQIAVPFLEHEACMLPKIAAKLPLAIPVPKWIGKPSQQGYPWPFVGYELQRHHGMQSKLKQRSTQSMCRTTRTLSYKIALCPSY